MECSIYGAYSITTTTTITNNNNNNNNRTNNNNNITFMCVCVCVCVSLLTTDQASQSPADAATFYQRDRRTIQIYLGLHLHWNESFDTMNLLHTCFYILLIFWKYLHVTTVIHLCNYICNYTVAPCLTPYP